MKKKIMGILGVIVVMCCTSRIAKAMWEDIPLDALVAQNPVALVGTIEEVRDAQEPGDKFDIAVINVEEVLKNDLVDQEIQAGDRLPLSVPSAKGIAVSTDIRYAKGTEGVWILEFKDKTFWATYPKDYQPKQQKDQIARIIREQEKAKDKPLQPDAGDGK